MRSAPYKPQYALRSLQLRTKSATLKLPQWLDGYRDNYLSPYRGALRIGDNPVTYCGLKIITLLSPVPMIFSVGKRKKQYHYDKMITPYEKLKSLNQNKDYLKDTLSFELFDKEAYKVSDNKAADQMNFAKK